MVNKSQYLMNTYRQLPNTFTHGEDVYLIDSEGNKYLDFVAGIAVNGLGYSHEKLKKALKDQVDKLLHISNLYYSDQQLEASKKVCEKTGFDKVFFCNSGAEAVEGSLKLARKYAKMKGYDDRFEIIAMTNSFHGRTFGAISATGQLKYQKGLDPLLPGVQHVPYNDIETLKASITSKTCAVIMEVIQGEGGIVTADKAFLEEARAICNKNDILLIFDEVQTGIGRLGYPLGYMHFGVKPDICAMAKGLGSGVPVGAFVADEAVAKAFNPGDHAATFGGNPLVMAAVNVVMDDLLSEESLQHIKDMGQYLKEQLLQLKDEFDCIEEVKGLGLMQGISLSYEPSQLTQKAYEKKLLLVGAGSNVVRFVPPLIISKEHIDQMIDVLREVL